MTQHINETVAEELLAIPRGGPRQNEYRMAYGLARRNALGAKPEIEQSPEAARSFALQIVRQSDPGFIPEFS